MSNLPFTKTKQNKTKQNKTKQNKTKQNKTKQNKTKQTKKREQGEEGVKGAVEKVKEWLPRLHSLVIGPGMGRDPRMLLAAEGVIKACQVYTHTHTHIYIYNKYR